MSTSTLTRPSAADQTDRPDRSADVAGPQLEGAGAADLASGAGPGRPVITGWAAITAAGLDRDAFTAAARANGAVAPDNAEHEGAGGAVPGFDAEQLLGRKTARFLDRSTSLTLAACDAAMAHADLTVDDGNSARTGITVGTTTGGVSGASRFGRPTFEARPYLVDAAAVAATVFNRAAGEAAVRHRLRGVNTTISAGRVSGLSALRHATVALALGRVESVLTGAVEELTDESAALALAGRRRPAGTELGEAAAMLVVERTDRARAAGRAVRAEVLGVQVRIPVDTSSAALSGWLGRILDAAEVRAGDVDTVSVSLSGNPELDRELELALAAVVPSQAERRNVDRWLGDCYSAQAALQIADILASHGDPVPGTPDRVAMVVTADEDGAVGCALLRLPGAEPMIAAPLAAPEAGFPQRPGTLHGHFLNGLATAPDATAVRAGSVEVTYRQLHDTALTWSGILRQAADSQDGAPSAVGVLAARGEPAYTGVLAALYTGGPVVPLHPEFPAARTLAMIQAACIRSLIVDKRGAAALADVAAYAEPGALPPLSVLAVGTDVPNHPALTALPVATPEDAGSPQLPPASPSPEQTAYILFTSGSTGRPKGVPVSHGNVDHFLRHVAQRYRFTKQDVFSQTFDLTFDLAMFDLFACWGAGGTLVSVPSPALGALPAFARKHGLTVWFSAPSTIGAVRRLRGLAPGALPTLRWSLFCGEPLLHADAADWQAAAPSSAVENLYGPTELTIACSAHRWDPERSARLALNGVVPIGLPFTGLDYVLAAPDGTVAADSDEGELCMAGPQMIAGYLDPADDDGRFLDHGGRRWYRTGDVVRRVAPDELGYIGRRDHQVKVRGARVELAEVEGAMRRCPGVDQAVAVVADHGGERDLVVFYTGTPRPFAEFAERLSEHLPRAVIPRLVVHAAELPLNPNRKIDRKALTAQAQELYRRSREGAAN